MKVIEDCVKLSTATIISRERILSVVQRSITTHTQLSYGKTRN